MGSLISSSRMYDKIQPLYFDSDVDTNPRSNYYLSNYELELLLHKKVKVYEKIKQVRYYTQPLYRCQMTKIFFRHAFIVLKTDNKWWWSIEKDEEGVTIQRSKHLKNVRDNFRRQNRITGITTGIDLVKTAPGPGKFTVVGLLNYLGEVDYKYNRLSERNSEQFAELIYQQFK